MSNFEGAPSPERLDASIESHTAVAAELARFLDRTYRPLPQEVASLIEQGMSEADILAAGEAAGYQKPRMEQTLQELDTIMPYLFTITDHLAEHHGHKRLFWLARDVELLADIYAIAHPDKPSVLVPGSIPLWRWILDSRTPLAGDFFAAYGLSLNGSPPSELIDTGFVGRAGYWIWVALSPIRVFKEGNPAEIDAIGERLPIKLVCGVDERRSRFGDQIMDLGADDVLDDPSLFPKVHSVIGRYRPDERSYDGRDPMAYRVALSLQLMPHFTGPFERLAYTRDGIAAIPRHQEVKQDVDTINRWEEEADGRNASIVNPLAALLVQYKVVRAAIFHHGQSEGIANPNRQPRAT